MEDYNIIKGRLDSNLEIIDSLKGTFVSGLTLGEVRDNIKFLEDLEKSVFFDQKSLKILENNQKG